MFTEILFITATSWKRPRHPSTERINKLCALHTMECDSALKRQQLLKHPTMWMTLTILCSGTKALHKDTGLSLPFTDTAFSANRALVASLL